MLNWFRRVANETSPRHKPGVRKRLSCVLGLVLMSLCCRLLDPDFQTITRDGLPIHVLTDTPEVRRLLREEKREDEQTYRLLKQQHTNEEGGRIVRDMMEHPERYAPRRKEFLKRMAQQPGTM